MADPNGVDVVVIARSAVDYSIHTRHNSVLTEIGV
jgi:hypothetical protein